ncbi:GNAT family N-acetyltransferase [Microbacterium karelineae]|uniref:GNAT family N-acetyltransferase n=1 Tax=Microbacterium karelineae TaxID=2654283 RepID=UPI0012EAFC42|nr:GNAT family N-acetyltransferase [Microbacterium karelineae]
MPTITTTPITPDHWDDVQQVFEGGGDGPSCQCMWPMMRNADFSRTPPDELREAFRHEIGTIPAPGLILHVDDEPAGWVRIGPRPVQKRLAHTRGLPEASAHPLDDGSVWALTCFSIPRAHRGEGIMSTLLEAAIAYARENGARVIEAYPRDPATRKVSSNDLFVGSLSTFTRAGFEAVAPLGSTKQVVQLAL